MQDWHIKRSVALKLLDMLNLRSYIDNLLNPDFSKAHLKSFLEMCLFCIKGAIRWCLIELLKISIKHRLDKFEF